jgi:hypothetical protein
MLVWAQGTAAWAQCAFYTVTMEDGDGDTEITWSLVDQNGVVWASAGAPYEATLCLPEGCYTLLMYDSGGNGWDGLEWDMDADDSNWDQQGTLANGTQGQVHFATENGTCANAADCAPGLAPIFIMATPGGSPNQMTWTLSFNGVQISSGGSDTRDTLCLPTGCLVLNQFDSGGNGWQTGTVRITDASGTVLYNGTLASGSLGTVNIGVNGSDCNNPTGTGPGGGGTEPGSGPGGGCSTAAPGGDCALAGCACDPFTFGITPSGPGNVNEVPAPGTLTNPSFTAGPPWGGTAPFGCLLAGELNSTWIVFTVGSSGLLQFSFGANGQQAGFYDWAMWPYTSSASCGALASNGLAPVRCVWNSAAAGGTGLASPVPTGGNAGNFAPPLAVTAGQQFIICLSNWSYVNANVTLDFFGTAGIQCGPTLLPVELLGFSAYNEGPAVHTQWTTATELNSDHFDVERSADGEHWAHVGSLPGAGNSLGPLDYTLYDPTPLRGWSYYRLKQVDANGSAHISQTEAVFRTAESGVAAWPQPSNGTFDLRGFAAAPLLFDATGRQVSATTTVDQELQHVVLHNAAAGIYLAVDPTATERTVRVVVQ